MSASPEAAVKQPTRDELVKELVAKLKAEFKSLEFNDGWLKLEGETLGYISHGTRVTRVDRTRDPKVALTVGNERQPEDHPQASSWTSGWEAFRLKEQRDVAVIAKALIVRGKAIVKAAQAAAPDDAVVGGDVKAA